MFSSVPLWMMILGFLLMLGPLVTLHELGHYLVGRWFGVKAEAFSVGFGKELAGFTDKRGTRWKLSALPLGGYVQFAGDMNPASQPSDEWLALPEEERGKTFQSKALWQRALIVAAGPVTNFVIAVMIFAAFAMIYGKPSDDPGANLNIAGFSEQSSAYDAGLREGDRLTSIDGTAMRNHTDVIEHVVLYPDKTVELGVARGDQELTIPVKIGRVVETDRFGNEMVAGRLGVAFAPPDVVPVRNPIEALGIGLSDTRATLSMMLTGLGQIVTGQRGVEELGGPIKMAKYSGEQLSLGVPEFVQFIAFVSINLAFINLLPIPVLDGGHLAFYAVEAIRRKPASPRSQEWAFRTGMALVLALMLFVTVIDIASLPIFGS